MRRSKDNQTDGDIHNTTCDVEPKVDTSPKSTYAKLNQALEGEDGDGNSGTVEHTCTVPKKNGILRFIQDLQVVNKMHTRSSGSE